MIDDIRPSGHLPDIEQIAGYLAIYRIQNKLPDIRQYTGYVDDIRQYTEYRTSC